MPCETDNIDGLNFIICNRGGGGSGQKCRYCHRSSTRLCDFEIGDGKTCDAPMCDFCTHKAGRNLDLCPEHRPAEKHSPRRNADAPRWIKAIYPGRCRLCATSFAVDTRCLWFPKEKKIFCESCGKSILEAMKTV